MKELCNDEVKKALKVSANILIMFLIFSNLGIVIASLSITNYFLGWSMFPFSPSMDPPYLIIILIILSILAGVLIVSVKKVKKKVCFSADLPMLN